MQNTFVVVADESRGRIFSACDRAGQMTEVETLIHPKSRVPEKSLGSHTRGTFQTQHGNEQHGLNTKGDLKGHQAVRFAKDIVSSLKQAQNKQKFSNLIIVAAPKFLGVLRKELDATIDEMVALELDKDLTKLTAEEIRKHLPKYLPTS